MCGRDPSCVFSVHGVRLSTHCSSYLTRTLCPMCCIVTEIMNSSCFIYHLHVQVHCTSLWKQLRHSATFVFLFIHIFLCLFTFSLRLTLQCCALSSNDHDTSSKCSFLHKTHHKYLAHKHFRLHEHCLFPKYNYFYDRLARIFFWPAKKHCAVKCIKQLINPHKNT